MAYLASWPGRVDYVHTSKHGSWLNLIESAFSKMARRFPRHIRVTLLDELMERILNGIEGLHGHIVLAPRGELKRELIATLRHAYNKRVPRGKGQDRFPIDWDVVLY